MAKATRKGKKGKIAVDPADLVMVDVFEHAKSIMSAEEYAEALEYGDQLRTGLRLQKLREISGNTQSNVRGFKQESVSQIERRADLKFSTLSKFVGGLGYELVTIAVPSQSNASHLPAVVIGGAGSLHIIKNTLVFDTDVDIVVAQNFTRANVGKRVSAVGSKAVAQKVNHILHGRDGRIAPAILTSAKPRKKVRAGE